jgi:hypothetical protein
LFTGEELQFYHEKNRYQYFGFQKQRIVIIIDLSGIKRKLTELKISKKGLSGCITHIKVNESEQQGRTLNCSTGK